MAFLDGVFGALLVKLGVQSSSPSIPEYILFYMAMIVANTRRDAQYKLNVNLTTLSLMKLDSLFF
jgi:hypothetical protein